MFREMRRKKQLLSEEECIKVLNRGTSGVLAVQGEDDYPYAVPLSYVYKDAKIYFHCAKKGYKLDMMEKNSKVSFCVIDQDQIVPEEFTTYYRSVIAFGKVRVLEMKEEIEKALCNLCEKYSPKEDIQGVIEENLSAVSVVELEIDYMTGKEAKEFKQ